MEFLLNEVKIVIKLQECKFYNQNYHIQFMKFFSIFTNRFNPHTHKLIRYDVSSKFLFHIKKITQLNNINIERHHHHKLLFFYEYM